MKVVHITNGEWFNAYFEEKYSLTGIPFNEAMMIGELTQPTFTSEFFQIRARALGVPLEDYLEKLSAFRIFLDHLSEVREIILWFGKDAFCQLNLLTILSHLEEINYLGNIYSVIIDDHTKEIIREQQRIELGNYNHLYEKVLIQHQIVTCADPILQRGIELYFDYLDEDGLLFQMVKGTLNTNENLPKQELVAHILHNSKEYGITDLQVMELIKKIK